MTLLVIPLFAIGTLLFIPAACLALQVLAASLPRRPVETSDRAGSIAVLVPAHDEAAGIGATLISIRSQLGPDDRCLVVADNCTDETARIAAAAGAEVVERFDPHRRGKGYALDFGVRALSADPPSVVIIVDADCIVEAGALRRIAAVSAARGRPAQALYLITNGVASANRRAAIAEFAFRVKNWVRPLGSHRLGLSCPLMGTGMAFPWELIRAADLATAHLVEDMKLGIDLAAAGAAPVFCVDARVTSRFPTSDSGTASQRTRWEHGHLSMIVNQVPGLLWTGIVRADLPLIALALDLAVPPLALFAMIVGMFVVVTLLAVLVGAPAGVLILALIVLALLTGAIACAWLRFGRDVVSPMVLATAPFYALRKIPLYVRFLFKRQSEWIRSKRDAS